MKVLFTIKPENQQVRTHWYGFIISQDQLAESCNITFSFYFGGNAWLMILNFYLSPGTFNIRGFIFQWIKSLVWGQYVVCNVIF